MSYRMTVDAQPEGEAILHLDTEDAIAAYLATVIETGSAAQLTVALRDIAHARRIGEIAA